MQLRELQETFSEAIFNGQDNPTSVARLASVVHGCKDLSTEALVEIYRNSIVGGLIKALSEIYPVCQQLVGEAFFDAMAKAYCQATPSRTADLAEYGETFADFIAGYPAARELPYLPDMARVEWRWHQSFHAADSEGLDLEALAQVPAEAQAQLQLHVAPSLFVLHSEYPVQKIWALHQADSEADAEPISLHEGGGHVLVWRDAEYQVYVEPVIDSAAQLLNTLKSDPLLATALAQQPDPEAAAALLPELVQRGWLCGFSLAE